MCRVGDIALQDNHPQQLKLGDHNLKGLFRTEKRDGRGLWWRVACPPFRSFAEPLGHVFALERRPDLSGSLFKGPRLQQLLVDVDLFLPFLLSSRRNKGKRNRWCDYVRGL